MNIRTRIEAWQQQIKDIEMTISRIEGNIAWRKSRQMDCSHDHKNIEGHRKRIEDIRDSIREMSDIRGQSGMWVSSL